MTNELELPKVVRRGDSGPEVHRIQEWLGLRGHGVRLDGVFGPATELALRTFQKAAKLEADGVATPELFRVLNAPMRAAVEALPVSGATSLGDLLVQYATRHLRQQPREVGGDNRGPWVRLYMDGHEGTRWRWCAGFVTFCLQQACSALRLPLPVRRTFSCDLLSESAQRQQIFVAGDKLDRSKLRPGDLFLSRRVVDDWVHTGIVTSVENEAFTTIEGNTDDGGNSNGREVAERTRSFEGRDFILLSAARNVS